MKTQIKQIDYNGNFDINGNWWTWKETCDECGKLTESNGIFTMSKPNIQVKDYCLNCLRKMCDNMKG